MTSRLFLSMLLLLASSASASERANRWVSGSIDASTYAMTAANADISRINSALSGYGLSMNPVTKGPGVGAAAGWDLAHGLTVGLGYDRLFAHSNLTGAATSIAYAVPANLVRVLGRCAFVAGDKTEEFVELSLGSVSTGGRVSVSAPGMPSRSTSLSGSCLAWELGLGGREWTSARYAISGGFGYRHARSGGAHLTDYSGLFLRAGLTRALTK
jgi:hypothetical protein